MSTIIPVQSAADLKEEDLHKKEAVTEERKDDNNDSVWGEFQAIAGKDLCEKYPLLDKIHLSDTLHLRRITAKVLRKVYEVKNPGDRAYLVKQILKKLFDPKCYEDKKKREKYLFWITEATLKEEFEIVDMKELDDIADEMKKLKMMYFFEVENIAEESPYMTQLIETTISADDPNEALRDTMKENSTVVGVTAALVLTITVSMCTNGDIGQFGSDNSVYSNVCSLVATMTAFMAVIFTADNCIRLGQCPLDKIFRFVRVAFNKRRGRLVEYITKGYLFHYITDPFLLLLFSVGLVGVVLFFVIVTFYHQVLKEISEGTDEDAKTDFPPRVLPSISQRRLNTKAQGYYAFFVYYLTTYLMLFRLLYTKQALEWVGKSEADSTKADDAASQPDRDQHNAGRSGEKREQEPVKKSNLRVVLKRVVLSKAMLVCLLFYCSWILWLFVYYCSKMGLY